MEESVNSLWKTATKELHARIKKRGSSRRLETSREKSAKRKRKSNRAEAKERLMLANSSCSAPKEFKQKILGEGG